MSLIRILTSMLPANLSFWVTDAPITLKQLDTAESLLVKIRSIFVDLYLGQGVTYHAFCRRAMKSLCAVEINYKIVKESINHLSVAYCRVLDVLHRHRERVIEAFSRRGSFDTEAALILLSHCEMRQYRGMPTGSPEYPSEVAYDAVAYCANKFGVFSAEISGEQLIELRNGTLTTPLSADNMAHAVFFFNLLAKLHLLPRNWKKLVVNKGMLLHSTTNKAPTLQYLYSQSDKRNVSLYLDDNTRQKYRTKTTFYEKFALAVKTIPIRR